MDDQNEEDDDDRGWDQVVRKRQRFENAILWSRCFRLSLRR